MRRLATALVLIILSSGTVFPQAQKLRDAPKQQQPGRRQNVPPRRAFVENTVLAFYITQFRRATEVSDDVFVKVLPFLEGFVQDRFEVTDRRRRALNQLRMVINSGGSDEEIKRLNRELDGADADFQTNQQSFLVNVDPFLNTRQQGRLRIFLDMTDQQIRRILQGIQNPAQPNR
jgi:hypothetical protein